jgi:DNA-binding CsgD family transcriptional regulator
MTKVYAVVTFSMVQRMRKMMAQGRTYKAIAKSCGCSEQTVWMYAGPGGYLKHRHRSNGRNVLRLVG